MSISTRSRVRLLAMDALISYSLDLNELGAATLGPATVSNREGQVLLELHRCPDVTPSDLAGSLGLSRSAVARLLSQLRQEGFLSRSVDASDRRSVRVRLTAAGKGRIRSFEHGLERLFVARGPLIRYLLETSGYVDMPEPAAAQPALVVMERLTQAGARYVDDVRERLEPAGLQVASDRYALSLLHLRGQLRPTDLVLALRLTSGGVSQLLDRLEERGLVERMSRVSRDQRSVLVTPTPEGLVAAETILEVFDAHFAELAAALAATLRVRVAS